MKKEINDLLIKMMRGDNCIGETSNELVDLFEQEKKSLLIDFAQSFRYEEAEFLDSQIINLVESYIDNN